MNKRTVAAFVAVLVLAVALPVLAVDQYPGHTGHVAPNIPADPGAGRHRVSEHADNTVECAENQHIFLRLKVTVAPGGAVDLNQGEVESKGVNKWRGIYNDNIIGPNGFGVFLEGTHTVMSGHTPDTQNVSLAAHVAVEVAGENPDPDLDNLIMQRVCVAD